MANKIFKGFTCAIIALSAAFMFVSCDDTDLNEIGTKSQEVIEKPGNPDLTFNPIVDEEPVDSADAKSTVYGDDVTYGIKADISAAEYEYVIERIYKNLNYAYCNTADHKKIIGLGTEDVVASFAAEDGNVYTVTVDAPILDQYAGLQHPYWKVKDINLTSLRNYAEQGDTLYTEVQALVQFTSIGLDVAQSAALTLKDSVVRIMVAEEDKIIGRRYDWYREPKSETVEECQVVKTNIWKSGRETAEPTFIQLLPRSLATISLGEQETTDFGTFTSSNTNLQKGAEVNDTETTASTYFTIKKRTDIYSSTASNGVNAFYPQYTLTHRGCIFNDGDTTIVFPIADWAVAEAGNVLSNTTGSKANTEYKKMTNNVRTTYLEYIQDASEEGILYKKGDEVTEGWDTENSWIKVVGKDVIVHGEWLRKHTIGENEVIKFDSTFVRGLSANKWEIYTTSKDNTTGSNSIVPSTSAKSHGYWSWTVVSNKITENVTFATGTKQNVYDGTEYVNIGLTYKGKKLAFKDYSYEYSEGAVSGPTANGSNDDYEIFKQNTKVNATAQGNQTISATANGTIYVEKEKPVIPPFFPSEYGKFEDAKFSATVNPYVANSWYFGCTMTFENGSLALPIDQQGNPDWEHMTWWPGIKDASLNGAYYVNRYGKWYPTIASDQNAGMEWSLCSAQGGHGLYLLDYAGADTYGDWNCNDKNGKGQHTVYTNRLRMDNDKANGTVTLYFNNVKTGSWTYAK